MVFELKTNKSLAELDRDLRAAAANQKFGVLGVHDLREAMEKKGVAFDDTCLVYEICNPQQAKKVLELNSGFSSLLPCRISIYGTEGKHRLSTALPTDLAQMFNSPELEPIAQEVETSVKAIMSESAG